MCLVGVVGLDMSDVMPGQLVDGLLDLDQTVLLPHSQGGEVGVGACAVPVTLHGLGVNGDHGAKVLSHSVQQETTHPQVVTHGDALAGTNLELPLSGHDFGIGAGNVDSSIEASLVVSLDNVTAVNLVGSDSAVVGSLGSWETILGPSEGVHVLVQEGVLLLNSEPGFLVLGLFHDLIAALSVVRLRRLLVILVGFTKHQFVVAQPEGILVDCHRVQVDIGVGALSLASTAAVKVPDWQFFRVFGHKVECSGLGPQVFPSSVDPDIHGLSPAAVCHTQPEELVHDSFIEGTVESHL